MTSLAKHMVVSSVVGAAILAVNFGTGILVARMLGPKGRGELAVVVTITQVIGWLASLGFNEAVTYLAARRPDHLPDLTATSMFAVLVLGSLGVVVAQLVLPLALAAQDAHVLWLGRLFALTIYLGVGMSLVEALLSGAHEFVVVNLSRLLQPGLYLMGLVVLAFAGRMTVALVLASSVSSMLITLAWASRRLATLTHLGQPSTQLAKEAARYGIRAQGSLVGGVVNTRLDISIMPAILSSREIGLYSVATNSSWVLVGLIGNVNRVLFPAATRLGRAEGEQLVLRVLRLTVLAGMALAVPLFVAAPQLLSLMYGPSFAAAAPALRILLVAALFNLTAGVLASGLQAVNRPLVVSLSDLAGTVVTLIGLGLSLRALGILGAAWTSLVAYAVTFLISLVTFHREAGFSWSTLASVRPISHDMSELAERMRGALSSIRRPRPQRPR